MFCSACGTQLNDDAKFCKSCGAPVYAPPAANNFADNSVYAAPTVEPAPAMEPAPAVEPVSVMDTAPAVEPVPVIDTAPTVEPVPVMDTAPTVEPVPVMDTAPAVEPVPNVASAPTVSTGQYYASSGMQYAQDAYANQTMPAMNMNQAPGNPNFYPNSMNMAPDTSQNWGPLMPPRKKSKAPLVICLSVLALLIVTAVVILCVVLCSGGKGGSSSARDALVKTLDAYASADGEALMESMHPIWSDMVDSSFYQSFLGYDNRKELIEALLNDTGPVGNIRFRYSNLNIDEQEIGDSEDIADCNEDIADTLSTGIGLNSGNLDDYLIEAITFLEGSFNATINGEDEFYLFEAELVKIDGKWYTWDISFW